MALRADHVETIKGEPEASTGSKKRKPHVEPVDTSSSSGSGTGGAAEEVVPVKLDTGEVVSLCIAKERADAFRDLRQAQRARFAKFFKQLTDDLQCGKELPTEHELYQYLASSELARLRELASLIAKDKSKPLPPPPPRPVKPEFDQAVSILIGAHPCHVKNWPRDALYTSRLMNEYDVRNYGLQPQTWPTQPTLESFVEIRPLPDDSHPAYPGLGVFASHAIPGGAEIGMYTGVLRKRQQTNDSESLYIAALTRETDIDAELVGNEVRFINDYRNTGREPNVKYERAQRGPRLILIVRATRAIAQDDELLVDYGDEYWRQLHKNRRRRALREANQYSDVDTESSSEEPAAVPTPRRSTPPSLRHSEDGNGIAVAAAGASPVLSTPSVRAWCTLLEELAPRGNRAVDWLIKEEVPELLATGRRRFTVPAALADEAEVFVRLHWPRAGGSSWRLPDDAEPQALVRAYDEHQKAQLRARAARAAGAYAVAPPPRKRVQASGPSGDEGANMYVGYPELLGLLQLAQLRDAGTVTTDEFQLYKGHLTRAFLGRFNS